MKHYNKKKGILTRECSKCGGDLGERYAFVNFHHENYDKPLEVIWLCRPCHLKLHNEISLLNNGLG